MKHDENPAAPPPTGPRFPGWRRTPARAAAVTLGLTLPWGVWLLVRMLGLEAGYPLVPAIAFTPYIALTALLPPVVAGYLRSWRLLALTMVPVVAFAALVTPRAVSGTEAGQDGSRLVVLTANLYQGRADLGVIADLVERAEVDVLAVQELTPEAAEAMTEVGVAQALPHDVVDARPGVSGSAIYARHPVTDVTALDVADTHAFARPSAEITIADAPPVEVTSAHPVPPTTPDAVGQWQREIAALPRAENDGPLRIIAGDFNATLDHAALRELLDTGYRDAAEEAGAGLRPTWSTTSAVLRLTIDHVLADERVTVDSASVHNVLGSDHRAVLAEFTLPAT
ncbi:endonuclease/exonuclease/phosphatase family protein [Halostreptopolyspora alba]|uniref:endonuclease/exonuclease/phosphatase family protein n=1 Tax=Halostreptopolyspora alba TaxID=2487137 RepID=UPI0037245F07